MVPANASHSVILQVFERGANALAVGFAYPVVAAHKRRERDRLWRGKRRVPPGAVLHCLNGLPVRVRIFIGGALPDELLACLRVLTLAESRKVFGGNGTGKAELRRKAALPLARNLPALRPVVLFLRYEFFLVVALRLACGEGF